VAPGSPALLEVIATFGDSVIKSDGTLDRVGLGALVFADAGKRSMLNSILHPYIIAQQAYETKRGPALAYRFEWYEEIES